MSKSLVYDSKFESQRAFWLKKLAKVEEWASLGRSGWGSAGEREYGFSLPEEVVVGLKRMAGESVFLLYTALLSAVQINMYRYRGGGAVVSGSPRRVEGEPGEGERGKENRIAIVTEIGRELSFRECLLQVRENLLEAYKNQDYPLEALLRDLKREEGGGLFELVVGMRGLHEEQGGSRGVPAVLMWEKEEGGIRGRWRFAAGWMSEGEIEEFSRQIVRVLEAGVRNHQGKVWEMGWMEEGEQAEMVERLNRSGEGKRSGKTVVELFEEQVKRTPEAVALVAEGRGVKYRELNE